jgi:hypothetical protein
MITKVEAERAVASAESHTERILLLAATLTKALGSSKDATIVVGGSAIEIYTSSQYVSEDLDLVAPRQEAIKILESWGFAREGRIWWRSDWKIAVDLVGPDYTGSRRRTQIIDTRLGPVRLAAVEDLVIKRLVEAKHFQSREALEQALMLASEYQGRVDEEYLNEFARKEDVVDILEEARRKLSGMPRKRG